MKTKIESSDQDGMTTGFSLDYFQIICGNCGNDSFTLDYDRGFKILLCKLCGTILNNYVWKRLDYNDK